MTGLDPGFYWVRLKCCRPDGLPEPWKVAQLCRSESGGKHWLLLEDGDEFAEGEVEVGRRIESPDPDLIQEASRYRGRPSPFQLARHMVRTHYAPEENLFMITHRSGVGMLDTAAFAEWLQRETGVRLSIEEIDRLKPGKLSTGEINQLKPTIDTARCSRCGGPLVVSRSRRFLGLFGQRVVHFKCRDCGREEE